MFLKEKRDKTIKGRTVARGNKQCNCVSKKDVSLPTVSTESVLLSCIIDVHEGGDVAVMDIPNAFIQTRVECKQDMVVMKLCRVSVDTLLEIAPETCKEHVTKDKKKNTKQLIVQCQNAICGVMMSSPLCCKKFMGSIMEHRFEVNPCDPCIANKTVDGKQMTILCHVDDCKLSHIDLKASDKMIEWLQDNHESIFEDGTGEMKMNQGKVHKFSGMTLDFMSPGEVVVTMLDHIKEPLSAFQKAAPKMQGAKTSAMP